MLGSVGILRDLLLLYTQMKSRSAAEDDKEEKSTTWTSLVGLIDCFLIAWFIAGNVWIYSVHSKVSFTEGDPNYCDSTTYLFAFWITTLFYIMIALLCCCSCLLMCCAMLFS